MLLHPYVPVEFSQHLSIPLSIHFRKKKKEKKRLKARPGKGKNQTSRATKGKERERERGRERGRKRQKGGGGKGGKPKDIRGPEYYGPHKRAKNVPKKEQRDACSLLLL